MNDADMADVEAIRASDRDLLDRLTGQGRMMFEHQGIEMVALLRLRPREPDEGDDRTVAAGLLGQLGKLELRVERIGFEVGDDGDPPDTGGRNSATSLAASVR